MTRVPGFLASAIASGIKKNEKKDLALIFSKTPASAAGLFTTNVVKAAPVLVGMERVKSGLCQAIVVNSGNANACTGKRGIRDAKYITQLVARELGIKESLVIPSSTGLIGVPLPVEKIRKAIPKLVSSLSEDGFKDTADAIMTTDQFKRNHPGHRERSRYDRSSDGNHVVFYSYRPKHRYKGSKKSTKECG